MKLTVTVVVFVVVFLNIISTSLFSFRGKDILSFLAEKVGAYSFNSLMGLGDQEHKELTNYILPNGLIYLRFHRLSPCSAFDIFGIAGKRRTSKLIELFSMNSFMDDDECEYGWSGSDKKAMKKLLSFNERFPNGFTNQEKQIMQKELEKFNLSIVKENEREEEGKKSFEEYLFITAALYTGVAVLWLLYVLLQRIYYRIKPMKDIEPFRMVFIALISDYTNLDPICGIDKDKKRLKSLFKGAKYDKEFIYDPKNSNISLNNYFEEFIHFRNTILKKNPNRDVETVVVFGGHGGMIGKNLHLCDNDYDDTNKKPKNRSDCLLAENVIDALSPTPLNNFARTGAEEALIILDNCRNFGDEFNPVFKISKSKNKRTYPVVVYGTSLGEVIHAKPEGSDLIKAIFNHLTKKENCDGSKSLDTLIDGIGDKYSDFEITKKTGKGKFKIKWKYDDKTN